MVLNIALVTAMRPSSLWALSLKQFKRMKTEGEMVWCIINVIESRIGASKTNPGGWQAVRDRPSEICVWNKDLLDGSLNIYKDICDYMDARLEVETTSKRFFLGANRLGKLRKNFLRAQNLGRNAFSQIVKTVCEKAGVTGSGFKDGMTTHGLRGTVVTRLFESGFSDSNVVMRTGHRDYRSLKNYHNLRGKLGQNQQDSIFDVNAKRLKVDVTEGFNGKENAEDSKMGAEIKNLDQKEAGQELQARGALRRIRPLFSPTALISARLQAECIIVVSGIHSSAGLWFTSDRYGSVIEWSPNIVFWPGLGRRILELNSETMVL